MGDGELKNENPIWVFGRQALPRSSPLGGSPFMRVQFVHFNLSSTRVLVNICSQSFYRRHSAGARQCYTMSRHRLCLDNHCERRSKPRQNAVICFIFYQEPKGTLWQPTRSVLAISMPLMGCWKTWLITLQSTIRVDLWRCRFDNRPT